MKHTPGPWKFYHEVFRAQISSRKIIEIQDSNGIPIVKWSGFDGIDRPKKETIANARLIAAAPELLDALDEMIDAFPVEEKEGLRNVIQRIALGKAKAAIAKAEGE